MEEEQVSSTSHEVARLQGELETLRGQYLDLKEEFQTLQASNSVVVHQMEKLEALKYKFRNRPDDTPSLESISHWPSDRRYSIIKQPTNQKTSCVSFHSVEIVGVASDYTSEERMEKVDEENEQDLSHELNMEEEKVEVVQTQHGQTQAAPREMARMFRHSQMEWEQLQEELRLCKEELQLCKEEIERLKSSIPIGGWVPVGGMKTLTLFVVLAGGLILYSCLKRFSGSGPRLPRALSPTPTCRSLSI